MQRQQEPLNVYETRVRSHQTDLNAAMYHGAYLDIFDDARIEMFRRMDYTYERMLTGKWTAVVRQITARFHTPARMDDLLAVTVGLPRFTRASMTVAYQCRRDSTLVAEAESVYVFVNAAGRPIRVPADLVSVVEVYANRVADFNRC